MKAFAAASIFMLAHFVKAQQVASDITVPYIAPIFPPVSSVPVGSWLCNGNKIYQTNYATSGSTIVSWILTYTCTGTTVCKITLPSYVGCV
ncbi:UNVERIFIED_CONTAM: hypothetical protein HDU68_006990 [Siphonaria sp. JEL0065]|nr:hypothetical protein HDU68_006990 [Siphonaria sp. JEL0065]